MLATGLAPRLGSDNCRKGRQPGMTEQDTLSLDTIPPLVSAHHLMANGMNIHFAHTHTHNYHLKGKKPKHVTKAMRGWRSKIFFSISFVFMIREEEKNKPPS